MFSNGEAYFNQTLEGESRWWSWAMAFWFTIIGWIIAQNVIAGPIPYMVMNSHPELYDKFMRSSLEMFSDQEQALKIGTYMLGAGLCAVLTAISWALNRFNNGTTRTVFGWITGIFAILTIILGAQLFLGPDMSEANAAFLEMIGVSPAAYALMLLTFPAVLVGLYLGQKFIHKRTITSLHTAASKINWRRIIFAIVITWLVYGTFTFAMHVTGFSKVTYQFDGQRFFIYALISLLLIPLQSGTEEIIFRGYLNQGFAHIFKNKWIAFIISSALFASMHLANPEAAAGADKGALEHLMVMSGYFLFGFILCIIVYFEGGLEAVIGIHAANNMFAAIFVNYEGSVLPTPSMFISPAPDASSNLFIVLFMGLIGLILYKTRDKNLNIALTAASE